MALDEPPMPDQTAKGVLEIAAGRRCPCGHTPTEHRPPDLPDSKPGDMGPCSRCPCKGLVFVEDDDGGH